MNLPRLAIEAHRKAESLTNETPEGKLQKAKEFFLQSVHSMAEFPESEGIFPSVGTLHG